MKAFQYTVRDELGLHARPAGALSQQAKGYRSSVTVTKGNQSADVKRIFALMGLGVKKGDTVTITIDGPDENAAVEELSRFCEENL